jgi:hypothetical protein
MGLDYSGKPQRGFKRVLKDTLNNLTDTDPSFFKEDPVDDIDGIFNDLAKTLIKGSKLKAGLGDMNPAAFIPVEEGATVKASLQRMYPTGTYDRITFGQFKEACEFIASRNSAIDEEFLLQFEFVDPKAIHVELNSKHKGQGKKGKDWITQFLEALVPMAGVMLASYVLDVGGINQSKPPTPDGENTGTQTQQQKGIGSSTGLALLIEMGMTYLVFSQTLPDADSILTDELEGEYNRLRDDPAARREQLESVGYDYDALIQNKKFDDYKAIKIYCLDYISSRENDVSYDHWIAWANVVENQELVSGSLAMAPMFSKKWKIFSETNDPAIFSSSSENTEEEFGLLGDLEQLGDDIADTFNQGAVTGLKNYFGSVLTVSNDHYNKAAQTFSMQIDARLMCCIVWFLGPLDTSALKKITELLRLLALTTKVNWKDLLSRILHDAMAPVLNMIVAYVNKIINGFFNDLIDKLFNIKNEDWAIAISKCIGLETLFDILEQAILHIVKYLNDLVKELNALLDKLNGKATALIEMSAERRWMVTLAALIDSIVDKIDKAMETCQAPEDVDPAAANNTAAGAAVDFVSTELPTLYPILNLSEDVRRKFFSDVPSYKTKNLNLEVPGFGPNGEIEEFSRDEAVADCGEGGRALQGILIGQKIADSINNK